MIPLLLLAIASFTLADEPSDELTGKWKVIDEYGMPCIMVYAQIDLSLSYIREDDSLADAPTITVPIDSITNFSSCYEKVEVEGEFVDSQVLQLDFPNNEGWNVRLAFTEEAKLDIIRGDYALFQVSVTANYSAMPDFFQDAREGHIHTYHSPVDFKNPPQLSDNEYTRVGYCLYCPDPQEFIINANPHNGPTASIRLSNLQMQAYMTSEDFGKKDICSDDQKDLDMVPVVASCVLLVLTLFTLAAYFVYRSRLPSDILNITQQEFAEEEHEHHHHKEHSAMNGNDNHAHFEENGHNGHI
ncbi:hypothetical protein PRIPAC_72468 [Pristionchus pacificus]|uniref:Uncharacterized protein n=1 Tax=Pristionchus pacificus TaxID=54126 RepID=A0A2A6B4V4_PRIPA|nr:hypothetical protein PRIPAC_72468 [Pristionchus pacificus]|eukprot:PDM60909.1 hypothetical protein PRIPAC_54715 [Pristionchus pacificus]